MHIANNAHKTPGSDIRLHHVPCDKHFLTASVIDKLQRVQNACVRIIIDDDSLKTQPRHAHALGVVGRWQYCCMVERLTFSQRDRGSKLPVVERRAFHLKGPGFKTTCCHFETWAISFTPLCLCLSEETLKAIGPFYLVSNTVYTRGSKRSLAGKWKKTCDGLTNSREGHS